jgi:hypothetical protein
MSAGSNGRLSPAEYAALVARVQLTATAAVPPGAHVLVLSKGDSALLELPGRSASHFPQDAAGAYAGHHPSDSAAAIAHLRQLQAHGAEYLVIPATASWWLDYYAGFAEHLVANGQLVADAPGACLVYELGPRGVRLPDTPVLEAAAPRASAAQIRDYLENLIGADSRLAVLESAGLAAELAPLTAVALAPYELSRETLARLAARGVDYLVVPRTVDEWLERDVEGVRSIHESCRKVADQRHLCRVFELKGLVEHV